MADEFDPCECAIVREADEYGRDSVVINRLKGANLPADGDRSPEEKNSNMDVVRIDAAEPYEAARHHGMSTLRLQGGGISGAAGFTVGLSQTLPGGGADMSASDLERVYLVLDGELTVTSGDREEALSRLDSCWIPPGEKREISNRTNCTVSFLVFMPSRKEP